MTHEQALRRIMQLTIGPRYRGSKKASDLIRAVAEEALKSTEEQPKFEVLALTNGYFQVMRNSPDNQYWVPVSREYPTMEQAQAEAKRRNEA